MTNHWADIANATNIVVWGANPAENHPACIAHVNRARFPKQFFAASDPRSSKKAAKLIVIDPRKTRTAALCDEANGDRYVRIRPGTDIALENGLLRYMIAKIEAMPSGLGTVRNAFFDHLNFNYAASFWTDGTSISAMSSTPVPITSTSGFAGGNSKYTDARFLVNATGTDYQRATIIAATGAITSGAPDSTTISNFPLKAASVTADPNTVYNRLKAHVEPYTQSVVAGICGCTEDDIAFVGDAFIDNSVCSNGADPDGRPNPRDATDPDFRVTTILYAMGITQHTCGSQNIKGFALIQTLMGNQGRQGGGINALRGIHNVQGSTDMGLLNGNIPAYSGNPATQVDGGPDWRTTASTNNAFGKYMDALWGTPLSGKGNKTSGDASYNDAYYTTAMALQQRGFYNMTLKWFGDYTSINGMAYTTSGDVAAKRAAVDACYSLWPKGNGSDHITMFREMADGTPTTHTTKAAVIWGQNPAVTEPNQGAVRTGLYELDTLVCVDVFQNETNAVSRKSNGWTYLIPAAAYVEKAGSATNSGRTLQWRYQATLPSGNTKDDTELLLRLAKALETANAFTHIKTVWDNNGITYDSAGVYKQLYQVPYGGYTGSGNGFAGLSGTGDIADMRKFVNEGDPNLDTTYSTSAALTGSEWVNEMVYREFCSALGDGGTMWIYTDAYGSTAAAGRTHTGQPAFVPKNRAKSRNRWDGNNQLAFPGWGYAWLVNRRVFYNNENVPGDVKDGYQEPDGCSRLYVTSSMTSVLNYTSAYRKYHGLADKPSPVLANNTASPHFVWDTQSTPAKISYAGRFPAHTEPYETPRQDLTLATSWGRNTKNTGAWDLVKPDTVVAGRGNVGDPAASAFPLVLTTIRCVEHFQGGPITRNNWWNVELEPEPWIELNSVDAMKYNIKDGDYVKIVTARTEALTDDEMDLYGDGFRARIGSGLSSGQRVGAGTVAIPWHWGDKGLSTGSRANDLTIDAGDANSVIPEYKACLCRIEKI